MANVIEIPRSSGRCPIKIDADPPTKIYIYPYLFFGYTQAEAAHDFGTKNKAGVVSDGVVTDYLQAVASLEWQPAGTNKTLFQIDGDTSPVAGHLRLALVLETAD